MEHLTDVSEAYAELQRVREREANAKRVLMETVVLAREQGAMLNEIAQYLGTTRQYVQKLIRERNQELEARAAYEAYEARALDRMERDQLAGLGFTASDRQCGVCHRFKSKPSDVCGYCGDDPVTYSQGDPDRLDRARHDAAYAGGIR